MAPIVHVPFQKKTIPFDPLIALENFDLLQKQGN